VFSFVYESTSATELHVRVCFERVGAISEVSWLSLLVSSPSVPSLVASDPFRMTLSVQEEPFGRVS
jgi:hypothetical protein